MWFPTIEDTWDIYPSMLGRVGVALGDEGGKNIPQSVIQIRHKVLLKYIQGDVLKKRKNNICGW